MEKSLAPGKIGRKITTKDMIMCALFTALIAVGAFIKVPVPVVPFTLQFLFTMLAGLIMGGRLGAISVGLYAVLGLVGLPIFAEGGGIWYVLKPSFGYIIGFALGSQLRDRNADRILASVFILLPAGGAGRYLPLLRRGISCKASAAGISEDPELIARRDTAWRRDFA